MNSRQTLATVAVSALCVGILVIFTDIEVQLVRWVNCGAIATEAERSSEMCR
ncbi:MAG: hypothetical protein ACJ0GX_10625 [Parasynechococcus sp.]|uniref:hypothetical protein n=1 Tax=Parasynechococcus sp. TaxID=3101203 RepID=UPI001DF3E820|nr:hypothetical protein [Synechococcus sp. BS307-5m-G36]